MAVKKNEKIKKADEEVKRLSQTEEMQELYWLEEKARFRENTMKSVAYKKGENKGIKKGKEQGKKEIKIDIAKKMIQKNISIEIIKEITGLTEKEIKKLM